ncbi:MULTISPECIES: DUF2061 domain-containing protein [unclassified Candidatus Frackibacter]|uniref:DUF2061 domain-containing protein n=1 Tax=unclassified Candidatus Frackibacter TaxID=2648818 RepID=UPI00088ADA9E|nr:MULTISPECIES: DUF2061 domain-containing protein [unclassified Candidatus Frackibacter]SDC07904.1 Uncharacterized membrane protein [Candidatus Frackibacter sp. WG11]SEM38583.1 Uncharacterized membrane protein [Candidatus Frackibacter sp. WG12]SFL44266.1 Uncharacterized membrane protein [Candidatus Frackibacter sp. WG13]
MSNKLRRILKSVTWRITATTTTILIVYFLTGEFKLAGSAALMEVLLKTTIYYLHETVWDKVEVAEKNTNIEKVNCNN